MKIKRGHKIALLIVSLFLFIVWVECEQRFVVKGQVVDASTGNPIEGASISIRWTGHHFPSFYSSGSYEIEEARTTSDQSGYFKIPKYFLKSFYMGVYKKGYVCWSSNRIFLKGAKTKLRYVYWIRPFINIKLEPMTAEYPRFEHAGFVNAVASATCGLEGAGEEMEFFYTERRNRNKEK